ncbi:MAG: hypothetical protein KC457_34860, partial [Myxococcales bacterium]|nr:hypothetical protein [Myxococcales bacterium]
MSRCTALLVFLLVACFSSVARAHPTPSSYARVDFTADGARITQDVPVEELERAVHRTLYDRSGDSAQAMVAREEVFLRDYAEAHLRLFGPDDRPWSVTLAELSGFTADEVPQIRFVFT